MLTHGQIWAAIDALALRCELSPSGLARKAGLDPTSLNKSKRQSADGKERWPSTESLAKILEATRTTTEDFFSLLSPDSRDQGFAQASPSSQGFAEAQSHLEPKGKVDRVRLDADAASGFLSAGDSVLLSAACEPQLGERVLVTMLDGGRYLGIVRNSSKVRIEILLLGEASEIRSLKRADIQSVQKILQIDLQNA